MWNISFTVTDFISTVITIAFISLRFALNPSVQWAYSKWSRLLTEPPVWFHLYPSLNSATSASCSLQKAGLGLWNSQVAKHGSELHSWFGTHSRITRASAPRWINLRTISAFLTSPPSLRPRLASRLIIYPLLCDTRETVLSQLLCSLQSNDLQGCQLGPCVKLYLQPLDRLFFLFGQELHFQQKSGCCDRGRAAVKGTITQLHDHGK